MRHSEGDAERAVQALAAAVARTLEKNPYFELAEAAPRLLRPFLERHSTSRAYRIGNTAGKILTISTASAFSLR